MTKFPMTMVMLILRGDPDFYSSHSHRFVSTRLFAARLADPGIGMVEGAPIPKFTDDAESEDDAIDDDAESDDDEIDDDGADGNGDGGVGRADASTLTDANGTGGGDDGAGPDVNEDEQDADDGANDNANLDVTYDAELPTDAINHVLGFLDIVGDAQARPICRRFNAMPRRRFSFESDLRFHECDLGQAMRSFFLSLSSNERCGVIAINDRDCQDLRRASEGLPQWDRYDMHQVVVWPQGHGDWRVERVLHALRAAVTAPVPVQNALFGNWGRHFALLYYLGRGETMPPLECDEMEDYYISQGRPAPTANDLEVLQMQYDDADNNPRGAFDPDYDDYGDDHGANGGEPDGDMDESHLVFGNDEDGPENWMETGGNDEGGSYDSTGIFDRRKSPEPEDMSEVDTSDEETMESEDAAAEDEEDGDGGGDGDDDLDLTKPPPRPTLSDDFYDYLYRGPKFAHLAAVQVFERLVKVKFGASKGARGRPRKDETTETVSLRTKFYRNAEERGLEEEVDELYDEGDGGGIQPDQYASSRFVAPHPQPECGWRERGRRVVCCLSPWWKVPRRPKCFNNLIVNTPLYVPSVAVAAEQRGRRRLFDGLAEDERSKAGRHLRTLFDALGSTQQDKMRDYAQTVFLFFVPYDAHDYFAAPRSEVKGAAPGSDSDEGREISWRWVLVLWKIYGTWLVEDQRRQLEWARVVQMDSAERDKLAHEADIEFEAALNDAETAVDDGVAAARIAAAQEWQRRLAVRSKPERLWQLRYLDNLTMIQEGKDACDELKRQRLAQNIDVKVRKSVPKGPGEPSAEIAVFDPVDSERLAETLAESRRQRPRTELLAGRAVALANHERAKSESDKSDAPNSSHAVDVRSAPTQYNVDVSSCFKTLADQRAGRLSARRRPDPGMAVADEHDTANGCGPIAWQHILDGRQPGRFERAREVVVAALASQPESPLLHGVPQVCVEALLAGRFVVSTAKAAASLCGSLLLEADEVPTSMFVEVSEHWTHDELLERVLREACDGHGCNEEQIEPVQAVCNFLDERLREEQHGQISSRSPTKIDPLRAAVLGEPGVGKTTGVILPILEYARLRKCKHRVRVGAYTGNAAALAGGSTTTTLRGGGYTKRKASNKTVTDQWGDVILFIVDEVSMISLKENARLANAVASGRGQESTQPNYGDVGVLWLGDFAQMPPIGEDGLFALAKFDSPAARRNAVAAWVTDTKKGQLQTDGWTFWQSISNVFVLRKQCRASMDPEWYKLCLRRRSSYSEVPSDQREAQIKMDMALLNSISLGAPDVMHKVDLPITLDEWGVDFAADSLRVAVDMDLTSTTYGKVSVDPKKSAYAHGVGTCWRPWEVVSVDGVEVSTKSELQAQLASARGDTVAVMFKVYGRTYKDLDDAVGVFYNQDVVSQLGRVQLRQHARKHNKRVVTWRQPDFERDGETEIREASLRRQFSELNDQKRRNTPGEFVYVEGAPYVLGHNLAPELGLANGTRGVLVGFLPHQDEPAIVDESGERRLKYPPQCLFFKPDTPGHDNFPGLEPGVVPLVRGTGKHSTTTIEWTIPTSLKHLVSKRNDTNDRAHKYLFRCGGFCIKLGNAISGHMCQGATLRKLYGSVEGRYHHDVVFLSRAPTGHAMTIYPVDGPVTMGKLAGRAQGNRMSEDIQAEIQRLHRLADEAR